MEANIIFVGLAVAIIVLAIALYLIRSALGLTRDDKCNHQFPMHEVADLNRDPQCEHCKKYLSAIDPDQSYTFQWNERSLTYSLVKKKRARS